MSYRFYIIIAPGCRSVPEDVECPSDAAAMMHAGTMMVRGCSVEIWQERRFVGELGQFFSRWAPGQGAESSG